MITKNREGYNEFDIDPNWYENRPKGISAVVRCYGNENEIGPCIESALPLFDEILVTYTPLKGDRTPEIIETFRSNNVRIRKYPFKLKKCFSLKDWSLNNISCDSVHDFSYYTNWGMSLTKYSYVAPLWDADHILKPDLDIDNLRKYIFSKKITKIRGLNVLDKECKTICKEDPFQGWEPRFWKAEKMTFAPGSSQGTEGIAFLPLKPFLRAIKWQLLCRLPLTLYQLYLFGTGQVGKIYEPIFFHTRYIINPTSEKAWSNKTRYSLENKKGKLTIDVEVPECIFKTVEDYIK